MAKEHITYVMRVVTSKNKRRRPGTKKTHQIWYLPWGRTGLTASTWTTLHCKLPQLLADILLCRVDLYLAWISHISLDILVWVWGRGKLVPQTFKWLRTNSTYANYQTITLLAWVWEWNYCTVLVGWGGSSLIKEHHIACTFPHPLRGTCFHRCCVILNNLLLGSLPSFSGFHWARLPSSLVHGHVVARHLVARCKGKNVIKVDKNNSWSNWRQVDPTPPRVAHKPRPHLCVFWEIWQLVKLE